MNKLTIIGNLTGMPKTRVVDIKGVATDVTNFSVAVNERDRKEPTYFRVHAWRGLAKTCATYLKTGRKVAITGPVRINSYTDNSGAIRYAMDVRADEVEFLDNKPREELDTLTEADIPNDVPSLEELPFT